MKIVKLSLDGYRKIKFRDNDFEKHGSVLILSGKNGTGKTTIIEAINILLGKAKGSISQEDAKAVTDDLSVLEIEVQLEDDEIDSIISLLRSFLTINMSSQINFEEFRKRVFKNNVFHRKLTIKKWEMWNPNSDENVQEWIHKEPCDWPAGVEGHLFSQQTLCKVFSRVEDVNAGEVNLLNTQFEFAQVTSNQVDANRKSKTNTQLNDLITIPINRVIMAQPKNELMRVIRENITYISSAFDNAIIDFDESHFLNTGRVALEVVYGNARFPIAHASAGQKQAVALLTFMKVWSLSKLKPILLLDEPDLGMHPSMISSVTEKFKKEVSDIGASCIIATHSTDLIKSYSENVFRVVKDASGEVGIEKIQSLNERVKLLNELGAEFDLDYLISKIIFVESEAPRSVKKGLPDEEIYQLLVDEKKNKVLFKSGIRGQGSATQLRQRREVWNSVIEAITSNDPDTYTLRDRDMGEYFGINHEERSINTPYKNVEYFFVASPFFVSRVLRDGFSIVLSEDEVRSYFEQKSAEYGVGILNADCKKIWQAFLGKLRNENNFDDENIGTLEQKIIDSHKENGFQEFDPQVSEFLSDLSSL